MRAELTLGGHYRRSLKAYGGTDVLTMKSVPVPKPGANEVLIRVQATTVFSADRRIRAMDFPSGLRLAGRLAFGLSRPRRPVLGAELTGIVVALGSRTTRFKIGADRPAHGRACRVCSHSRAGCDRGSRFTYADRDRRCAQLRRHGSTQLPLPGQAVRGRTHPRDRCGGDGGPFAPLLDSVFAFEALPEAHARVDTGHKHGSVVVMI